MIDDAFVIDAVKHSHNLDPSNYTYPRHAKPIAEAVAHGLYLTSPLGSRLPEEYYQRNWGIEDTASTTFLESDVEVDEFRIGPESNVVGKMVRDLHLPRSLLLGGVVREDGSTELIDGSTILKAGETVVVFARPKGIAEIQRVFACGV